MERSTEQKQMGRLGQPPLPFDEAADAAEGTGLLSLHTWRGVYLIVGGVFVLWVALLAALTFLYS